MSLPTRASLVEVGPRDGLQSEQSLVPAAVKVELVHRLLDAGVREMEVTSFVSPERVPQLGDGAQVMGNIRRPAGVQYSVLTPNLRGFTRAMQVTPDEVVVFTAASQAFCQRNLNCSIEQSFERFAPIVDAARARGVRVRGAISMCLGCPYEGDVDPKLVKQLAGWMRELGAQHLDIADTLGIGTPRKVQAVMESALSHYGIDEVSAHFHDTYGQALSNILACLHLGIHRFDASVAGLGGCPFAPGSAGNVASEDLVYMLHGMGIETGIDLDKLVDAGKYISDFLNRKPHSRAANALLALRRAARRS